MLILMYVQRRPLRLLPYFQTFFWASQEHLDDLRSCKTPGWTHECGFRVACFKNTWKIHGYSWILPWINDSFKALRAINSSGDILETVTPTSKRTCRMQRRSKLSEHGKSLTHCGVSLVGKWLWDLMEWPLFTSANYVWEYIFVRRAEVCFAGCFQQFSGSTGGINKSYTFVVGNMGGHLPGCRQRADELGGWSGDLCFFGFATQKNNNWKHTEFNQFNGFSPKKKKKHQLVSSRCQPASSCCVHLPFQKWLRGHLSVDFFRRCPAQKCTALLLTFFTQAGHAIHEPHPGQHWHLPTALRINSIRASLLFRVITTLPEPSESWANCCSCTHNFDLHHSGLKWMGCVLQHSVSIYQRGIIGVSFLLCWHSPLSPDQNWSCPWSFGDSSVPSFRWPKNSQHSAADHPTFKALQNGICIQLRQKAGKNLLWGCLKIFAFKMQMNKWIYPTSSYFFQSSSFEILETGVSKNRGTPKTPQNDHF